jgi:hypothetical protein
MNPRTASLLLSLALTALCAAQGDGVLLQSRPDVWIAVRKSNVTVDYVTVKLLSEDYSADLLRKQCEAVGSFAGGGIRGLEVTYTPTGASPGGKPGKILQATFAVDGLIDQQRGILNLNPLAKAFASSTKEIAVIFENQTPLEGVTLRSWNGPSAVVAGQHDSASNSVEYRISLKTQDPKVIDIPLTAEAKPAPAGAAGAPTSPTNLIPYIVGGAILAGVLVYFALRPYRKVSSAPKRRDSR